MNKQRVEEMLNTILINKSHDRKIVEEYFSIHYQQVINDRTYQLDDFLRQLYIMKASTSAMEITIESIHDSGNLVFSNYSIKMTLPDGTSSVLHVIASFQLEAGKIVKSDEMTFVKQAPNPLPVIPV